MDYTFVPSHFTEQDIAGPSFSKKKFHRAGPPEFDRKMRAGLIECLDAVRRIWKWRQNAPTPATRRVKGGRVSRQVPPSVRKVIESEMAQRPLREEVIDFDVLTGVY